MKVPVHVTTWGAGAEVAIFIHGSGTWSTEWFAFQEQQPLSAERRLLMMDRRGYGFSPPVPRNDCAEDARDVLDLIESLSDGPHLVGHSSGGVVALLAAAKRPDKIKSLTLIEPAAYQLTPDEPAVSEALERHRRTSRFTPSAEISPADWMFHASEFLGIVPLEPTPMRLAAAKAGLNGMPFWEVDIPLRPLIAASFPKLIIAGDWKVAPAAYREHAGEAMMACGRALARRIDATFVTVPGSSHWPQSQQSTLVNRLLQELWKPREK